MNTLRRQQAQDTKEPIQTQLLNQFSLQKDFLPAFPQEAEKSNAPFQQSRLLMSHMGFIHYNQLKEGVFQMLNKTPALFFFFFFFYLKNGYFFYNKKKKKKKKNSID
jgi:hypothetical protein